MSKIKVSAPGKLMLFGEHAVVYGFPCIVTAIDKRITVEIEKTPEKKDRVISSGVSDTRFVDMAIAVLKRKFTISENVRIKIQSDLGQYGLGSSSAVTVATLKGLLDLFSIKINNKELFQLAYETVLSVQGKASGFDVAASIYGGAIYFDGKTKAVEKITESSLPLVIGFSGIKADTSKMINQVAMLKAEKPRIAALIFSQIGNLVKKAKKIIKNKNWIRLGEVMLKNQSLLDKLGVVSPKLAKMTEVSFKAGAYGAKISGAGGGDCMIALVSEAKKSRVLEAIGKAGGQVIDLITSGEGVRQL